VTTKVVYNITIMPKSPEGQPEQPEKIYRGEEFTARLKDIMKAVNSPDPEKAGQEAIDAEKKRLAERDGTNAQETPKAVESVREVPPSPKKETQSLRKKTSGPLERMIESAKKKTGPLSSLDAYATWQQKHEDESPVVDPAENAAIIKERERLVDEKVKEERKKKEQENRASDGNLDLGI